MRVAPKLPNSLPARYVLATAAAGISAALQWLIRPWVGSHEPFLFFLIALVFAVISLGRGPAVLVLSAGLVNAALLSPPVGSLAIHRPHDMAAVLAFAIWGGLLILFGTRLHLSSARAALAEKRLALAQTNTGVGIFELNFAAGTAFVSPSLCRMLGSPIVYGEIGLAHWFAGLRPEHVAESVLHMQEQIARGELLYEREQRVELPTGKIRWLLNRVELESTPAGALTLARGATVDITARKEVDELLQRAQAVATRNERRFSVALESSSVPFCILAPMHDRHGKIIDFQWSYLNPAAARALGRQSKELTGRGMGAVLPRAWEPPGLFDRYVRVVESGEQCDFEVATEAANQGLRWYEVIASPLYGSVAIWFTNITERKQRERKLEDADRRKDEFLATLAHELRNPLAPIRQAVRIAGSIASTEAQRRWSHAIIERQVHHMSIVLDDLLDVSRIGRGTLLLRKSRESLSVILNTAIEAARPHIEAKRHHFSASLPPTSLLLEIDPVRMTQVIGNLLTNAAKYTDPGGHIQVSASVEADALVIRVSDDGIGLSLAQQREVFEMFSQVPAAVERSQGGLGIGLALARGLVELHGGSLEATSGGLGHGTEFSIRLPRGCVVGTGATAPAALPSPRLNGRAAMNRRILIADDNEDAADSLAELLRLEGHEVHVAYDGEGALATFERVKPDTALIDVGMPRISGLEVARAIRRNPAGERATLIAVTGWGQERDRQMALDAGFDHHMTKPMLPEDIQQLIEGGRGLQ